VVEQGLGSWNGCAKKVEFILPEDIRDEQGNYYQVLGMYSDDYVDRFQTALAAGKIRPYQGKAA